ncbi:hypothetical protein [Streptomyces sp. NEAU-L66]
MPAVDNGRFVAGKTDHEAAQHLARRPASLAYENVERGMQKQ